MKVVLSVNVVLASYCLLYSALLERTITVSGVLGEHKILILHLPNFIVLSNLGWLNSFKALIVPWLAMVFNIFMLKQFFMSIPQDLLDAAQIDGCSSLGTLWRVIIPLSRPVLVTSGLFTFIGSWNSFMWPLIVTNSPEMQTIQVGLATLKAASGTKWELLMAASTFSMIPLIILFFFVQKQIIESFAHTGLKG